MWIYFLARHLNVGLVNLKNMNNPFNERPDDPPYKYKDNVHTLLNHNPLLLVVTLLFNIKMKVKILLPAGSEYGFPAPLPRRTVDSLGLSLLLKPAGKRNYKSYFYFFIHWHHGQHLHCIYFVIEVFFHIARVHSHGYCGVEKVQVKPDKDHYEDPFNI